MTKLWILQLNRYLEPNPGIYDCMVQFVIRAADEWRAREIAEGEQFGTDPGDWLNPLQTTCTELLVGGDEEVIISVYV